MSVNENTDGQSNQPLPVDELIKQSPEQQQGEIANVLERHALAANTEQLVGECKMYGDHRRIKDTVVLAAIKEAAERMIARGQERAAVLMVETLRAEMWYSTITSRISNPLAKHDAYRNAAREWGRKTTDKNTFYIPAPDAESAESIRDTAEIQQMVEESLQIDVRGSYHGMIAQMTEIADRISDHPKALVPWIKQLMQVMPENDNLYQVMVLRIAEKQTPEILAAFVEDLVQEELYELADHVVRENIGKIDEKAYQAYFNTPRQKQRTRGQIIQVLSRKS